MIGYTAPPRNPKKKKKVLNFSHRKDKTQANNHAPTLDPATATPSAVARYLEKWVEILESAG